jgi:hypothetical protein
MTLTVLCVPNITIIAQCVNHGSVDKQIRLQALPEPAVVPVHEGGRPAEGARLDQRGAKLRETISIRG